MVQEYVDSIWFLEKYLGINLYWYQKVLKGIKKCKKVLLGVLEVVKR